MNCAAFIFARGGSKGIPNKNIKSFAGNPLIAYSIKVALNCPSINDVYVSTDSHEIANIAEYYGAKVPFIRPVSLAEDESAEWEAWRHAVATLNSMNLNFDIFVSLPATSPLRSTIDVEACIHKFIYTDTEFVVTGKKASRNPYFNMVAIKNGYAQLAIEDKPFHRRQDAPELFDLTTVCYVTSPHYIMNRKSLFDGKVSLVEIPEERAIDIDTNFDFIIAECLIRKNDGAF